MNFENEFFLLFNYIFTKYLLSFNTEFGKGQYISKQNCWTVVRIEKQIRSFFGRVCGSTILFRDLLTFRVNFVYKYKNSPLEIISPQCECFWQLPTEKWS